MIHARLDRKTQKRVLCGGNQGQCPGEFGWILDHAKNPDTGAVSLTPQLYLKSSGGRRDSLRVIEKCPRCGEDILIDLSELRPVGPAPIRRTL